MKHRIPTSARMAAAAFALCASGAAHALTAGTLMTRANQAQVRAANGL